MKANTVPKIKLPDHSPIAEEAAGLRYQRVQQVTKACEHAVRRAQELVSQARKTRARTQQLRKNR